MCNRGVMKESDFSLCCLQDEFIVLDREHLKRPLLLVGSDDATTCLILSIVSKTKVVVCHLSHVDSSNVSKIEKLLKASSERGEEIDLHLVGGFPVRSDDDTSDLDASLQLLHQSALLFNIKTFCVGSRNVTLKDVGDGKSTRYPFTHGSVLSIDNVTGAITCLPAHFENKARGPALPLRFCRSMLVQYCCAEKAALTHDDDFTTINEGEDSVRIPFIRYLVHRNIVPYLRNRISLPKEEFLKSGSTSPEVEKDRFVDDIKSSYLFMLSKPSWTQCYPAEKMSLVFKWSDELKQWT
jgi:hypothetical protein